MGEDEPNEDDVKTFYFTQRRLRNVSFLIKKKLYHGRLKVSVRLSFTTVLRQVR